MLVRVNDLHGLSIDVKDLLYRCAPLTFPGVLRGLLNLLDDPPPLLRLGIPCDLRHIRLVIRSMVFVIAEQQIILQEDRIVADVASPNGGENLRPHLSMVSLVG